MDYQNNLANLTSIGESLFIRDNNSLTNIDGLANITSIAGYLQIQDNTVLANIDGLSNLTSITEEFRIWNNSALTNLDGLSSLSSFTSISIEDNYALANIDGLSNITSAPLSALVIKGSSALTNLDGLANITSIGSIHIKDIYYLANINGLANLSSIISLTIEDNPNLTNLDGLANLSSITSLRIDNNDKLTNIDDLTNITSIALLFIHDNYRLPNLDGLANLTSITGSLTIWSNSALANIDGLVSLTSIGTNLSILHNNVLANIDGLANLTSVNILNIHDNNKLTNLDGLANVSSEIYDLLIYSNLRLGNIDGLINITTIRGGLRIEDNYRLTNLNGLFNLTYVGGEGAPGTSSAQLKIYDNHYLGNLNGLANLTYVGGLLIVRYNNSLTNCCGIQHLLNTPGAFGNGTYITNNPMGCNNQAAILNLTCSRNVFVDANATGANNGESWLNAFSDLQDALSLTEYEDIIHIAEGTYLPSQTGTRAENFNIPSDVTLLGGYPTGGGGLRDPDLHETILSGNIDNTSIGGDSYHVILINHADNIEIDGLTIRDGNADDASSYGRSKGGGLFISNSSVKLTDVEVKWNRAVLGGAIFAISSDVIVKHSTFKKNRADNGAAFYYSNGSELNLYYCNVVDNSSNIRCALESNNASKTIIKNSIIANNKSDNANALGFIVTNRNTTTQIINSTILGKNANRYLISIQVGINDQMNLTINNSIVAHQDSTFDKNIVVYNNNVFNFNRNNSYFSGSGIAGNGANNLFASTAGDLQLNADYSLANSSPAVNAGNDALAVGSNDIFGNPRFMGTVDIGAAENQMVPRYMAENQEEYSFNVFPNPTSNFVTVDLGKNHQEVSFTLRNILGQVIFNKKVNNTNEFHFEIDGVAGLYLLEIETKEGDLTTFKILKK